MGFLSRLLGLKDVMPSLPRQDLDHFEDLDVNLRVTCYTPEPTDEHGVTTPISPLPDMQSPIREMPPYPLGPYGKSMAVPVSVKWAL
jgi:hypothetical protein